MRAAHSILFQFPSLVHLCLAVNLSELVHFDYSGMAESLLTTAVMGLAERAGGLSTMLYSLKEDTVHSGDDVALVATELMLLSATLWRLGDAFENARYTESFNEDLAEILQELKMVFNEVAECGLELQKAGGGRSGLVSWFFKRGRVHYLQKHLETLKTTLVVMRTVLWHGKDYGTER